MYDFDDVEELARKSPDTFKILPKEVRETLQPGDYAKLMFRFPTPSEDSPNGERMWVKVAKGSPDGETYLGVLSNIPTIAPDLKLGDLIYFKPNNVCQIMRDGNAIVADADDGNVGHTHKDCNDPRWR